MTRTSRRSFLSKAGSTAVAATTIRTARAQDSPNDRINVAVIGFHWRGMDHIRGFAQLPNVRVAALCDVDERLFPPAVAEVERLSGHRPITEYDMRRLLERKDIDAVSIATPDYWHALQTIWACQAGKDVYVEKPVSFTVVEGRKMVEAARKYKRIVQAGTNQRSEPQVRAAMRMLNDGKMGKVYRASATSPSRAPALVARRKLRSSRRALGPLSGALSLSPIHAQPLPLRLALFLGDRPERSRQHRRTQSRRLPLGTGQARPSGEGPLRGWILRMGLRTGNAESSGRNAGVCRWQSHQL